MSTSDAGELELRGGERATPQHGTPRSAPTREHKHDEKQRDHRNGETEQHRRRSATRREGTHNARALRGDGLKKDEASHRGAPSLQNQRSNEPRFTSSLFLKLSSNLGFDRIQSPPSLQRSREAQQAETKNESFQVCGGYLSPHASVDEANACLLSETTPYPAKKEAGITAAEQQDSSKSPVFSNGDLGAHEPHSFHVTGVTLEEARKDHRAQFETRTELEDHSEPSVSMLSSTVVTVLAPHWSGRIRRPKKTDGTGSSDAHGNFQDPTVNRECGFQEFRRYGEEGLLARGPQAPTRVSPLGPRSNTAGWSGKSDPPSVDYDSKRQLAPTVSLDVKSGRIDNSKAGEGAVSPLARTGSSGSLFFVEQKEDGRNLQTGNQGRLSSLSSKPTTSSLLLSLRRFNSGGRNADPPPAFSNLNPAPRGNSQSDQIFTTHLSQGLLNKNEKESPKPMLSPSSLSYKTPETGPVSSPSASDQRERSKSDIFFSTPPIGRNAENSTISRTQSGLTSPTQAFLSKGPSDWQQNSRASAKSATPQSEVNGSLPKQASYDRPAPQKPPSVPRATLTSTSWWKQVAQDGNSSHARNDTTGVNNMPNTPMMPPCHENRASVSPSPNDNKRLGFQIPSDRDNNNAAEFLLKSNTNPVVKTQGGAAETSPGHQSERLVKQQYNSNLNSREALKPYSMPDVVSRSKISRAPPQTALTHSKDPSKRDASNSCFTTTAPESPPASLSPKSPNPPTESSREYNNNQCPSKPNSTPTPAPPSPDVPTTLSPTPTPQAASALSPSSNTKSTFSFYLNLPSSQAAAQTSSNAGFSSQTPKFADKAKTTPLGFERTYVAIPKPFQSKTVSSLMPAVASFTKTNHGPVGTTSGPPSSTATSPRFSPPVSPASKTISSLLTPPATPVLTSSSPESSSLKGVRSFTSSLERNPKKKRLGSEEKKARRVTWDDSVDLQCSEPAPVEKQDPPQAPLIPLSPSRSPRSTPSIFSVLRSGSPTNGMKPLCSPIPKTSSIQVGKGGRYRSLSSDSADSATREREKNNPRAGDAAIFDKDRQSFTTPRQERTLSVKSGTAQSRSSTPLSLPPDFSRNYKLRYSSPPYSSLVSSRLAHGETKTITPRSPLFSRPPPSRFPLSLNTDRVAPARTSQPLSLPFQSTKDGSKCSDQPLQSNQLLLLNNRVHFGSQSLQGDKASNSYVTETLVYSIKQKADAATGAPKSATPKPLQHNTAVPTETKLNKHCQTTKEAPAETRSHSDQSSSGSSSTESQSRDSESSSSSRGRMKETVLGKSRFYSVEVSDEQSPKKSRFTLKKSISTPNASLSRSDSDRSSKTSNRMDQVFTRLKQKFSMRRTEDDLSFPWKWKKSSQTPSVSGSSDVSSVSDASVGSTKTLEDKELTLDDNKENIENADRWTQNRYTIIPSSTLGKAGDQFSGWAGKPPETSQHELNACLEDQSESKVQLRVHSPTLTPFDLYKDNSTDYKPANQLLSSRDPSPCRSPNASGALPAHRKSTPSPRSPFSPFASLSPLSPFPSPDTSDDVFYSPKMQRRKDSSSPCEPVEGISLGGSRKSRASTGPPSIGPVLDQEQLASSYADLKYGIEPGRSFSVSSVLSSRPSGPGRISIGSRVMSVGDLSRSALSCGGLGGGLDRMSCPPDWTTQCDGQPAGSHQMAYFPGDPVKLRSRSLPRSLTRRLADWSAEASSLQPSPAATAKPARLQSPDASTRRFPWDAEGPPTPPPTPPMSPVSRRMSQPPRLSSPTSPTFPGPPAGPPVERQSLSRGYVSSLSAFEESSDSSSDTTTDDEYYLETDEDGEKETEL